MGNYATQADIQDEFNDSTELAYLTSGDASVLDTDALDDAIDAAEADLNTRIAMRYATPVSVSSDTTLAALLKRQTIKITRYYLFGRTNILPDRVAVDYQNALDWADKIADGTYAMSGAITAASTTSRDPRLEWSDSSRTLDDDGGRYFSRDTMSGL